MMNIDMEYKPLKENEQELGVNILNRKKKY